MLNAIHTYKKKKRNHNDQYAFYRDVIERAVSCVSLHGCLHSFVLTERPITNYITIVKKLTCTGTRCSLMSFK